MSEAVIELKEVSIFYGEVIGLSRVSLTLGTGITGIVGPNGSGKTTLMRALIGLIAPDEGDLSVLEGDPFAEAQVRGRIAFVPATEVFFPNLDGERNLELALIAKGFKPKAARRAALGALEEVGLSDARKRPVRQWSRGMRQRLKLAIALSSEAEIILLDEPFLGVDPPTRRLLRDQITALAGSGKTLLLSSHVLHEVESLTQEVVILAHGRLLGHGQIGTLLEDLRQQHPHTLRLKVDKPRQLAAALVRREEISSVQVRGEDEIEIVTESPEQTYRSLAQVVADESLLVRGVITHDDNLDALFRHVTKAGAARL